MTNEIDKAFDEYYKDLDYLYLKAPIYVQNERAFMAGYHAGARAEREKVFTKVKGEIEALSRLDKYGWIQYERAIAIIQKLKEAE